MTNDLFDERERLSKRITEHFPKWRGRNFSMWREGKDRKHVVYFGRRTIRSKGHEMTDEQERLLTEYANIEMEISEIGL